MMIDETIRLSFSRSDLSFPFAALAKDVPPHVYALLKQIKAADKDRWPCPKRMAGSSGCSS